MSYDPTSDSIIDKIKNKGFSRAGLIQMRENVLNRLDKLPDDPAALARLDALEAAYVPEPEAEYIFLGFCPGGALENRLDEEWIEKGICKFDFIQSEAQHKRFCEIMPGDTVILKKREEFGKTMRIYSYGRVNEAKTSRVDLPYLLVDWVTPKEFLEVPLMGCNSTVDVRSIERVEAEMPEDFWEWLGHK
jgi:hypothetical protein